MFLRLALDNTYMHTQRTIDFVCSIILVTGIGDEIYVKENT